MSLCHPVLASSKNWRRLLIQRSGLALHLIESLDPGTDEDAEELWLEEAEKRLARFDAGDTEARPANDVLSEIRNKIG